MGFWEERWCAYKLLMLGLIEDEVILYKVGRDATWRQGVLLMSRCDQMTVCWECWLALWGEKP